jgi:DNA-binding response OmpR family regulator
MDGGARILVVDDERFFREAIRDALTRAGFACVLAEGGAEALERAESEDVGVVVLDIQMPGMNGIEVLRRLRETRPLVRVIILSAHTDQAYVLEALRLGAADYLAKPLHEEELVLAVRRALEGHAVTARWERLRARLEALGRQLAELHGAVRTVPRDERPALVCERAARAAAGVLQAARSSVLLLDAEASVLRVAAAVGEKVPLAEMDAVPVGEGVAGSAFARGAPIVVGGASGGGAPGPAPAGRYASSSFVVTPIGEGDERVGVLCATDRAGAAPFAEEDATLLRILGLEVASLLREAEPPPAGREAVSSGPASGAAAEPPGEGGLADGELARAICAAATSEVAPERILGAALGAASAALGGAPVSLYLLDPAGEELTREAQRDAGEVSDRPRLRRGRGLTGAVFATGRPVATGRPAADPRFDAAVDTAEDGAARPFVCVPLVFRRTPLGVFRAFPHEPGAVALRTAEVLGAALSAAVRNVLLYRSLLESIEELARVRRERGQRAAP